MGGQGPGRPGGSSPPASVTVLPLRDIVPPFRLSIATAGELPRHAADLADLLVAAAAGWPEPAAAESEDAVAPA